MASPLKPKRKYDVFLSFRGEDVRKNFLSHLYRALDQKGIYTYVDSEELGTGEQIAPALMKAIEESHIAIIVFSKDYASSCWCLEEVAKIMDSKQERDLMVFPLFYKVDPKEVRTPRERYREALVKHEFKFGKDSKKVKRWEKALSNAGSLSGWHLKDGDESELIQRILKKISIHLDQTPLHVAKHPIGIEPRVVKLKSMLNLESDDGVLMVGLWGQGGIGKTTLAKALYNAIVRQFEGSCFLANVRETSKDCRGLVTLQEKLLSEVLSLQHRFVVSSVDRGINLVQDRLRHKKILLIIDDVDDLHQLNALAGEGFWFGNGSRVIITTRDRHLLTCHGINQDHVYEVRALNDSEAHELLTKHAFLTHQKFEIKTDIVDRVLIHANGLPLALEVLGSFLCGRREDVWESALKKLSRIPNKDINNVLKISYDGLEENEKEVFLHIACFFNRWDSEYIKKVLDSCDFEVEIGLEILIERSLISIEPGILQMHDLIQIMGMDIVNQQYRDDPGRRSRLWLYEDVLNVLQFDKGDCAVKAIVLKLPELKEICIGPNAFTKMRRLRLLIMRNVHNTFQGPIYLSNELKWLEWPGCAPWIPEFSSGPKKLVGLDMSKGAIPVVAKRLKDFQNLKYINFSDCESLVCMPDFSCTPNLEELDLQNCTNLIEAHESIAYHDKLQVLNLKGSSVLSVFPNVLKSKSLRYLNLGGCTNFERFPLIPHKLEGLKELSLVGTAIKELPASIENLVSLEKMYLGNCKNLVSLPSSIYELQNIEILGIGGCTNLIGFPKYKDSADPCKKTGLSNLRWLILRKSNLSEVEFLENLSCFPSLRHLDISENKITSLPTSISKRDQLAILDVTNCHQLQEIHELPPLLDRLWAAGCESLQKIGDLTSIGGFVRRGLTLADITSLDEFLGFSILLPGGEMPEWVHPVEGGSVSFTVSEDLYDKFLGLVLCVIVGNAEHREDLPFEIVPHVNGERRDCPMHFPYMLDSNHTWLLYTTPSQLWGEVSFGQTDGSYVQFSLTLSGTDVKKWGFQIICNHIENDLRVVLQENQLMELASLYEVSDESTDSKAESSLMHEHSLIETDLEKDLRDCQRRIEKPRQIVSKSNRELILPEGMGVKTVLTSNSTGRDECGSVGLQLLLLE